MTNEVIECEEFGEIRLRVSALLRDGELSIDERISKKGYLAAAFSKGQISLRATRFVGTIPINSNIAVHVKPRANIENLSYMIARSGKAPSAISGFSRDYLPRFTSFDHAEKIYARSLVDGLTAISRRGFLKAYIRPASPTRWRGRFLASDTIRKHAAKGIRYRHEFDQSVLSASIIENIALKEALKQVHQWYLANDRRNPILRETSALLRDFWPMQDWPKRPSDLVFSLGQMLTSGVRIRSDYVDPLWSAFMLLQKSLPAIDAAGIVRLDSLIIDISEIYEAYVRRELRERLLKQDYTVKDGWKHAHPFFLDDGRYSVHPDIIIQQDAHVVSLLDAKYKPDIKEADRYEIISFMDAMDVQLGALVLPTVGQEASQILGTTASGKKLFLFRYNLAAKNPVLEADKFAENVMRMLRGEHAFL